MLLNIDKMPQYQLLFDDNKLLVQTIQILYCGLANSYTDPKKHKEACSAFKDIIESLFSVNFSCEDLGVFTEDEAWTILSDGFLAKRLQNFHKPLASVIEEILVAEKDDKEAIKTTKIKKWKGLLSNRTSKATHSLMKLFEFEIRKQKERFIPVFKADEASLFYGGQRFYSFFRHLHCLYERLKVANTFINQAFEQELERRPEINATFGSFIKENIEQIRKERYIDIFFPSTISYALGEIGTEAYEDLCKWLIGSKAYILFTLDKLVRSVYLFMTLDHKTLSIHPQ